MFIIHFDKILGILGHSIPLGDMWDNIRMTNGVVVVIKILQTPSSPMFVKIICLLGITLSGRNFNNLFGHKSCPSFFLVVDKVDIL